MGLSMHERHAVVRELSSRFQHARKKERGQILNDFVRLTGYTRSYGAFVLRNCGRKQLRMVAGRRVVFIPGYARAPGSKRQRRGLYRTKAFLDALRQFWALSDGLCGKRLTAFIREVLPLLEHQGSLTFTDAGLREHLLHVSAATVDRLLAKTKRQAQLRGRSVTHPGSLLKHHIPIRTFTDWNEEIPGFCETDLVAHDGGAAFDDYCQTLTLTDIATGWTEIDAVKNKAERHVFAALQELRARLPFPLLGIDSDNGSEFVNRHLLRYCQQQKITFTRSRPYRKNDNCFVEQKNYSIVRRTVGYYRYDSDKQLDLLHALYRCLRLYTNFFQPVMKLKEKVRRGSRVTRRYDQPRTPCQRVLEHPRVANQIKTSLHEHYLSIDLLALKRELDRLQLLLFRTAVQAGPPPRSSRQHHAPPVDHPWRTHFFTRADIVEHPASPPVDFYKTNHHTSSDDAQNHYE
jgi:hypothetical protein